MSDLRTRIANIVADHQLQYGDCHCGERFQAAQPWGEHVADAVIRELGLKVEYGMGGQHDYSDKPEIHPVSKDELDYRTWYGEDFTYRYVTEWETNE